ncbi:MAG: hemolysin family protein, partial [Longimicrobiales bacterium]
MLAVLAVLLLSGLALSALFSAAELSVFSLGDARIRTLVDEGFRGAGTLDRLRSRPERLLVLVRLGSSVANALVAGIGAFIGWSLAGLWGAALGTAGAAALILVAAELVPMRIAIHSGVRVALSAATMLEPLTRWLGPLLVMLGRLSKLRPRDAVGAVGASAERQVRELAAIGHTEGVIDEQERQLIERVFRLDETKVWDIMTPRVDIFAWDEALALAKITSSLGAVPYSRVPVFSGSIDNITGVLYLRDAYQALVAGQRDVTLGTLAREPLIVPGSLSLTTLLRDFQTRRIHLAVVVDEYGGTDGLVTLEDVLEELVGEIVDETDVAYEALMRISRHEIVAAGDADLREINHFFNAALPQLEHRSLNGYLLEELGRVPEVGETIEREGIEIQIMEASGAQVLRARLRRRHEAPKLLPPDGRAPE